MILNCKTHQYIHIDRSWKSLLYSSQTNSMPTFLETSFLQNQNPNSFSIPHNTEMYSYNHHRPFELQGLQDDRPFELQGLLDYIVDIPADESNSSFDPLHSEFIVSQEFTTTQSSFSSINGQTRSTQIQVLVTRSTYSSVYSHVTLFCGPFLLFTKISEHCQIIRPL